MLSVGKKNVSKEGIFSLLNTIEEIVKTMYFDIITTMAMEGDEGAKSKEYVDDCISKSEMKTSSEYTRNKNLSHLNLHII